MRVRLRQFVDGALNRLFAVPIAFVVAGALLSQVSVEIDRRYTSDLPSELRTTVESSRTLLSALAGGLITSATLLMSLMLVAVQLGSSQFSPRTLRTWLGDRAQQITIGVVLGTAVFCLLVLRATRTITDGSDDAVATDLVPHLGVLIAVALGVGSLIMVVRSVDRLTDSMRVGRVGQNIMAETLETITRRDQVAGLESEAERAIVAHPALDPDVPDHAVAVESPLGGWVQEIDEEVILSTLPDGATAWIATPTGTFVLPAAPLLWLDVDEVDDELRDRLRDAVALGDSRTAHHDVGFGIVRLVDIAVRALSPGVNDPVTATDIAANLSVVLLRLWERPETEPVRRSEGRAIVRSELQHADYLHAAFDPIRRYGAGDPLVIEALMQALISIRAEARRRELPGPIEPIEEMLHEIAETVRESTFNDTTRNRLLALVDDH